ncbi:helix-turn-helix domain-containing protein [Streptomyces sp. NPDC006365]|uniref:helix-turn-helix domain-containing protein n=1 Tax=Streptomyces sp. NPDC006365 TaxID=3364744 RepID=UPI00369869EE
MVPEGGHGTLGRSPEQLGIWLRDRRVHLGLSQAQLAETAGVSTRGIREIERGRAASPCSLSLLRLIAALGLEAGAEPGAARRGRSPRRGARSADAAGGGGDRGRRGGQAARSARPAGPSVGTVRGAGRDRRRPVGRQPARHLSEPGPYALPGYAACSPR